MKNYVLVIKDDNNYIIGRKRYTEDEALERQAEIAKSGLNMDVMHADDAFGINQDKQLT